MRVERTIVRSRKGGQWCEADELTLRGAGYNFRDQLCVMCLAKLEYSYTPLRQLTPPPLPVVLTPQPTTTFPPAAYNLSGGELSSDGLICGRRNRNRGSGTHSPLSIQRSIYY